MLEERAQWACLAEISGPPVDDYASAGPCRWGQIVYQRSKICRRGLPVFIWVHPAAGSDCSTFKARLLGSLLEEEPRHRKRGSPFSVAVTTSRRCWRGSKFDAETGAADVVQQRRVDHRTISKQQLDRNCTIVLGLSSFSLGRMHSQYNEKADWTRHTCVCVCDEGTTLWSLQT